jgi:hypothetical protein
VGRWAGVIRRSTAYRRSSLARPGPSSPIGDAAERDDEPGIDPIRFLEQSRPRYHSGKDDKIFAITILAFEARRGGSGVAFPSYSDGPQGSQ